MGRGMEALAWACIVLTFSGCVTYEELQDAAPTDRTGGPHGFPSGAWLLSYVPRPVQSAGGECATDCPRVVVTHGSDEVSGSPGSSAVFVNMTFSWTAIVDAIPEGEKAQVLVSRPGDYQTLACPATADSCALSGTTIVPLMVQRNLTPDSTWLRVAMQVVSDETPPRPVAQQWNLTVLVPRTSA